MARSHIDPSLTPVQLREMARGSDRAKQESFDRCDTDGFLSQWAHGITANLYELEADIREHGGTHQFLGLYSRSNPSYRIPAKMITVHPKWNYGRPTQCWAIIDPATRQFTGEFIGAYLEKRGQKKHNVIERREVVKAHAEIIGHGTGLSGTAWAAPVREDGGWSPDLKPVEDDA